MEWVLKQIVTARATEKMGIFATGSGVHAVMVMGNKKKVDLIFSYHRCVNGP